MEISIVKADYDNPQHAADLIQMLDVYSRDPMGQDAPLGDYARKHLIEGLKELGTAFTLLAYRGDVPVGMVNCIYGFSTFYARKLINIHDIAVKPEGRGEGLGRRLLQAVEDEARASGCCKITLEVRVDNRARNLYERFGFTEGDVAMDFMTKELL